jgi:hypothetical protein
MQMALVFFAVGRCGKMCKTDPQRIESAQIFTGRPKYNDSLEKPLRENFRPQSKFGEIQVLGSAFMVNPLCI